MTAGRPLTVSEIRDLLNEKEESIELGKIRQTLGEIEERHRNTSLCLSEVASGFSQVKDELSESHQPKRKNKAFKVINGNT